MAQSRLQKIRVTNMGLMIGTPMEPYAPAGHTASVVAMIVAWMGLLAPAATSLVSVASLIWFIICIWESQTIQHWKTNFIQRRRTRILIKLKANELKVQAKITALELVRAAKLDARDLVATAAVDAAQLVAHAPVAAAASKVTT